MIDEETKWWISILVSIIAPLNVAILEKYLEQKKPFMKRKSSKNKR